MFNFVSKLSEGVILPEPVLPTPGFRGPRLPQEDPAEDVVHEPLSPPDVMAALANRPFVIVYVDARGEETERRIVVHEVYRAAELDYIRARCLERQASRRFRVDRVEEVYCGITGEDLGAPSAVFIPWVEREHAPVAPKTRAAPRPLAPAYGATPEEVCEIAVRHALRVLMTVARCDGEFHVREAAAVQAFVEAVLPRSRPAEDVDELCAYAARQAPSFAHFMESFHQVFSRAPQMGEPLLVACARVIAADGRFAGEEMDMLPDLIKLAAREGVRLTIEPSLTFDIEPAGTA